MVVLMGTSVRYLICKQVNGAKHYSERWQRLSGPNGPCLYLVQKMDLLTVQLLIKKCIGSFSLNHVSNSKNKNMSKNKNVSRNKNATIELLLVHRNEEHL